MTIGEEEVHSFAAVVLVFFEGDDGRIPSLHMRYVETAADGKRSWREVRLGGMTGVCDSEREVLRNSGDLPGSPAEMAIAAVAVGLAIQANDGEYGRRGLLLIALALAAATAAVARLAIWSRPLSRGALLNILYAVLAVQGLALLLAWPAVGVTRQRTAQLMAIRLGRLAAAGLVVWSRAKSPAAQKLWFAGFLLVSLVLGVWIVHASPRPFIDVWVFQQDAAKELLEGHNPYAMTYPDIYHSTAPGAQSVYGEGLSVNDRLQFGFPYLPVSLFLGTGAYAVAGDHRYAQVMSLVVAGLLIGYSRAGRISKLAGAMLLSSPRVYFVIGRAWTEPFAILMLAATIFCASRKSRWTGVMLGLTWATKQYLVLVAPVSFLLLGKEWTWKQWGKLLIVSSIVAAAVTGPFAIWDFHAFWKSVVTVQQLAPLRKDALSVVNYLGLKPAEGWVAVLLAGVAAAGGLALSAWRAARKPAGFAAAVSLINLGFFVFNKQAFCNYYFFVIGAMCCAVGAADIDMEPAGKGGAELTKPALVHNLNVQTNL